MSDHQLEAIASESHKSMATQTCSFSWQPPFRKCVDDAPPPPESSLTPTLFFGALATFAALGAALHATVPLHGKLSKKRRLYGWQKELGELVESKPFVLLMVVLILVDLAATVYVSLGEEGEILEWAEWAGFRCLIVFAIEQLLHLTAFGVGGFFSHPWFVVDLFAVSVTAIFELNEELLGDHCKVFCFARLWKVAAFAFDVALVGHEASELKEGEKDD